MNIKDYLENNILICDGAFGTFYSQLYGTEILPERAVLTHPERVLDIHGQYVSSGARLLRTATFAVNKESLNCDFDEIKKYIKNAFALAKKAAEGKNVFVAADIGPIMADKAEYTEISESFLEEGADIFVFETLPGIKELLPALEFIKSKNEKAFIICQVAVNSYGYTQTGESIKDIFEEAKGNPYIDAIGTNCSIGPSHMYEVLSETELPENKYVCAFPNAGYPTLIQNRFVYNSNVNYFCNKTEEIAALGVNIIGGCCGTNPGYISELDKREIKLSERKKTVVHKKEHFYESGKKQGLFFDSKINKKIIAVELDPPKGTDYGELMATASYLKSEGVDAITFADSPSGRTRASSILMSVKVKNETGAVVMPHICCRDTNAIGLSSQILGAYLNGIRNFLVITGDPVPGVSRDDVKSVFNFDSVKLMRFIREMNETCFTEDNVFYGGAVSYSKKNTDSEIKRILLKKEAGATFFLTQPVYDDKDMETLEYIKRKTGVKMLCGIMPLVSKRNANFIKNEITGITVPNSIVDMYDESMTKEEGRAVGIKISADIMKKTYDFADGFYFTIPFNRTQTAKALLLEAKKLS